MLLTYILTLKVYLKEVLKIAVYLVTRANVMCTKMTIVSSVVMSYIARGSTGVGSCLGASR